MEHSSQQVVEQEMLVLEVELVEVVDLVVEKPQVQVLVEVVLLVEELMVHYTFPLDILVVVGTTLVLQVVIHLVLVAVVLVVEVTSQDVDMLVLVVMVYT